MRVDSRNEGRVVGFRSVLRLAGGLLLAGAASLAAEEPAATLLLPGKPVERKLAPGERHAYDVPVEAGQFLRIVLERRGIEAFLELDGSPFADKVERGTPTGPRGTVEILGVARSAGTARVVARAVDWGVVGTYRIALEELRAATPDDQICSEAQRIASTIELEPQTAEARARAVRIGAEAVSLYRRASEDRGMAEQLLLLGFAQFFSGKARDAMSSFREALELWRKLGDRAGEASTLNGIGMADSYMADYSRALEHYGASLELQESLADPWGQARVLSNMSVAYASSGEFEKARECLERSLPLRRAAGDRRGEAYTLSNLADYEATGNLARRIELKSRSAELARQAGDRFQEASATADLAMLLARSSGSEDKTLKALEAARALLRETGNQRNEGRVVSELGALQARNGRPREALGTFADAMELHHKAKDRGGEALTLLRSGLVHAKLGEEPEARAAYGRSLELYRASTSPSGQAQALTGIARLEMDAGRRAEARARLDEAIELIESLRQRISRRQDRAVFFSRWLEPYRLSTLLYLAENDARPGAGFDDRAFRETERARGRALAESVAEAEVRLSGDLPEDLRSRETELSSRLRDLQKRLASSEEGERRGIEEEIFQSEAEWQRFLVDVRARSRRYASLHFPEAISAERARALCDSSTAIVSYALAEPLSHVFVLTRTSLAIVSLPTDLARVSEEVSSFVGLLSSPQGGEPEKLAARLEEDLVEPWRRSLPASVKRLVIVPDGDLHSMPFEVLPQPSRGGRRLLDDFAVSYVPSVTLLAQLSALPRPPPGVPVDVLAFAAPPSPPAIVSSGATFDGERVQLGPLPGTGDEARFAALSGGAASRVYIGPEASEQRVKEERMDRYGVLHFATHTLVSAQVPSRSALVLAESGRENGLLQVREIYLLTLRAELVVLSGCRTARGQLLAGEGVESLAQAFFHAGARTVVASLWNVSDRHTAELMEAFYRHLAAGEPKSEALRAAKLDLLRSEPALSPHVWTPFVLIGEPAATVPLRPVPWWRRLLG